MPLKNTIKPTIRRLFRDKAYLLVSILSLSAGLLCFLFIFNYVLDELSYDRFHKDADDIYRLELEVITEDGAATRYARYSVEWMKMFPEVELETQFLRLFSDMIIETNGNHFTENRLIAADSAFFQLFSFGLAEGDPQTVLSNPGSVVLSRSTAGKIFGTDNVMGETFTIRYGDREALLTVTGVAEDAPSNSHLTFNLVASTDVYEQLTGIQIPNYNIAYSYFKVSDNADTAELQKKINNEFKKHFPDVAFAIQMHIQPMTDIRLHSSALYEFSANSNANYVYLFTLIAVIILGIAGINFTMLAASRTAGRARETGMRKVFGADKKSLTVAILTESVLLSIAGLVLAWLLAWFLLPYFNQLAGKSYSFAGMFSSYFFLLMSGIAVLTGVLSGLYPALTLTRRPAKALFLENIYKRGRKGLPWKSMVVVQFAISIFLIGATIIIHKQIDFIFSKDAGFDKEQIITFSANYGEHQKAFKEVLQRHPDIESVTASWFVPGVNETTTSSYVEIEDRSGTLSFDVNIVDQHFFETFGIPVIRGRNFSEHLASDSTQAFILNETAVKILGWSNPLGKKIEAWGREGFVIGVVKDFHFSTLHNEIVPVVFVYDEDWGRISAKIRHSEHLAETLSSIEEAWNELLPGIPFRYEFIDEQFAAAYESEQRAQSLFFSFSVLATIIAVLGLFSFTSYTIHQKTREIGIRKVLGATLYDILKLFYTGYAKLLLIATLIAIPAGYVWMKNWLQNFAYRTEIGIEAIVIPMVLALVILVLSVSYQVVKGAGRNPVDSIRIE